MKQAILDTSFILSCIRNKIDFAEYLFLEGYEIIIPTQVITEIKKFKDKKPEANLALRILENGKFNVQDLKNSGGRTTDKKIINYANAHENTIVATLDREIKSKTKNKKLVIRGKMKLEVV